MRTAAFQFVLLMIAFPAFAQRKALAEVHRQHDVLGGGQRRQELKELKHEPDVASAPGGELVFAEVVDRRAGDSDGTG